MELRAYKNWLCIKKYAPLPSFGNKEEQRINYQHNKYSLYG